jgi:hypothetical protein
MVIFKVQNKTNNKVYIGNAVNNNPNNLGVGKYIKRAIKDFGASSFDRTVLEEFDSEESLGLIMDRTEYWIKHFKADNPKYGYNESVAEMIPQKKRLTKKVQVLLSPEDEDNLNSIIIQKSMENGIKPMPISKYVRSIIVEHIVKEISPEKTINKII